MLKTNSILLLVFSMTFLLLSTYGQGKKTGIEGYIFRISGNRMPSPDAKLTPPKGIKSRFICISAHWSQSGNQAG
ncbi:MAG: hypothetical protein WDM78_13130 [Puia sp.]